MRLRSASVTAVTTCFLLASSAVAAAPAASLNMQQSSVRPAATLDATVTTPRAFLGFTPGDDYKLANYKQSYAYFQKIAKQTGRMRLFDAGKTAMGETMLVAVISSEANLARLDRLKAIARTLAEGRVPEDAARSLAKEGRAIVWIDGGMHATEVGSAQHTMNLGYDLIARNEVEFQAIRDRSVVVLVPSINPDGQNLVADWFNKNYGTPQEGTALPVLYQKYAGHDNNRDWYMLNLPETRNMTRLLYEDWFPQIVYNHHQAAGMYPERMFIPPYDDPMNPNIPPLVMRGINAVGTAMHSRFEEEGKTGIISLDTYSTWWNGGMRTTPFFHNIIGILTEVAHASPYPAAYRTSVQQQEPNAWYPNPYKGGTWRFADTVAYMNTGSMGLLNWAANNAEAVQMNRWRMARAAIAQGTQEAPYGFIIPLDAERQHDPNTAAVFLERMRLGGLEVHLAEKAFTAGSAAYPAGTAVILAAQANRPHLMDMVLPQKHPMRRQGPTGPPIPPYDIAGWTLTLQMGVTAVPMTAKPTAEFIAALRAPVTREIKLPPPSVPVALPGGSFLLPAERSISFKAANRLLAAGVPVSRWTSAQTINGTRWAAGTFAVPATDASRKALTSIAADLRLPVSAVPNAAGGNNSISLRPARVGTYDPYGGNMTQGWAQYVLETFDFPHVMVTNPDLRAGSLNTRLDTLVLPVFPNVKTRAAGARAATTGTTPTAYDAGALGPGFLGGPAPKSLAPEVAARLEGIGETGQANLRQFVEDGGTLVALDGAAKSVVELFRLPVREVTEGSKFYSPGSVFRVEVDLENPLCWGLTRDMNIFFDRGMAWETTAASSSTVPAGGTFARYPDKNPLLSGWIIEDQVIRGRGSAMSYQVGKGKVVVFGFDVTFRGQPYMGFPLLFNAFYSTQASSP